MLKLTFMVSADEPERGTWIQRVSFPEDTEEVMVMRSLSEKDMDVAVVRESLMISEADLWAAMTILSSAPVAPSVNFYAILPCNSCLGNLSKGWDGIE